MSMERFTITELSFSAMTIMGGLGALLMVVWKSRCSKIQCCYGGFQCEREPIKDETIYKKNIESDETIV